MDPSIPKSSQGVLVYVPGYPRTKKVAFQNIFRTDDPPSKENLSKTTSVRDEVYNAIEGGNASTIISTLERYLPQLFGLVVSVEENQKLRLNSPLSFSWTSAFISKSKLSYHTCYTYRFEVVMSLMTYGIAHINRAYDTLSVSSEGSFDEASKKAATLLRTAAGVFEYIQTRELPRWIELPNDRPMEVNANVCQALLEYFGLLGGTSKSTLAKLAVDMWNKYASIENVFKVLPAYKDANPSWKAFLSVLQALAKASAYKYMGESIYEQGKYGMAVSLLNIASNSLKNAWTTANAGLLPKYKDEVTNAQDDIEHVKRSFNNENNNIYFQPLVEENQLEIPEAKCLMTPIAWVPPQPAYQKLA